jgi:hypothetical protein
MVKNRAITVLRFWDAKKAPEGAQWEIDFDNSPAAGLFQA